MKKTLALFAFFALLLLPVTVSAQSYDGAVVDSESDGITYNVASSAGDTVTLNDVGDGTGDLSITFANGASGSVTATQSTTIPDGAPVAPDGTVNLYFDINLTGGLTNNDIASATWTFTVTKAWINEQGVTPQNIFLQHYNGSAWERLTTRILSETDSSVTYEADITSFSPFAVTAVAGLSNTGSSQLFGFLLAGVLIATGLATFKLARQ